MHKCDILKTIPFSQLEQWNVSFFLTKKIASKFETVQLKKCLKRYKEAIKIVDSEEYTRITVRMYGQGVTARDTVLGASIGTKRQFLARPGQLILSRIDARNGAFGIVPDSLDGAIVTNDFWLFELNDCSEEYIKLVLSSNNFKLYWQSKSSGTTNRQRITEEDFLNSTIPLPSLEEQKKIVKQYNLIHSQVEKCEIKAKNLEENIDKLLFQDLGIEVCKKEQTQTDYTFLKFIDLQLISEWGVEKNIVTLPFRFTSYTPTTLNQSKGLYKILARGKSPKYSESSNRIILNQKCNRWDEIILEHAKTVNAEWIDGINKEILTKNNDILINSTGEGTLGRASLVKEPEHTGLLYDSHMILLRLNEQEIHPQFFVFLFNSPLGQSQVNLFKGAQATKQTELGVENVKKVKFPFPHLKIQQEITNKITKIKTEVKEFRQKAHDLRLLAKQEFEREVFNE